MVVAVAFFARVCIQDHTSLKRFVSVQRETFLALKKSKSKTTDKSSFYKAIEFRKGLHLEFVDLYKLFKCKYYDRKFKLDKKLVFSIL